MINRVIAYSADVWAPVASLSTNGSPQLRRNILVSFVIGVSCFSIYSLLFFLSNKIYFIGSDAYYYMAIADSFVDTGSLLDLTSYPTQLLKTPQNGVVFVHVLLSWLGLGPEARLVGISIIGYLLHVSATYPLYHIARRIGLREAIPMAVLITVYLGAFHVYRLNLIAYNDGVFNAISIWLTYGLIVGIQESSIRSVFDLRDFVTRHRFSVALMVIFAIVLVHFRINTVLIFGAALVATVMVWKPRNIFWIICLLTISLASIVIPYTLVDTSRMFGDGGPTIVETVQRVPNNVFYLVTKTVPNLIFAPVSERASIIYFPFALVIILALISGLRNREPGVLFVAIACSSAFAYVLLLPMQPSRYLVYVLPLMFTLLLLSKPLRSIGYMFAGVVIASSLVTFATGFDRSNESNFWLHIYENRITLDAEDPLLVARRNRHPYFFLDTRTYRGDLNWELVMSRGHVFVLGDRDYVTSVIEDIKKFASDSYATFSQEKITADYTDDDGHVLIRIYDFRLAG